MRRTGLRFILTLLLLALAAVMCWLAQPALAPSDSGADSTEQPPAPTPSSDSARLVPFSHAAATLSGMTLRDWNSVGIVLRVQPLVGQRVAFYNMVFIPAVDALAPRA